MKQIYGIYSGCKFEGGGVARQLFLKKADAISAVKKRAKKENAWRVEANQDGFDFELFSETEEGVFETKIDIISIKEFFF